MKKIPTLDAVFRTYNRKYFGNKLKVSGVIFGKSRCLGETAFFSDCPPVITIDRSLLKFGRFTRMVLLHEMAHVAMPDAAGVGHGPKFIRRIRQLVKQGAYDDLL